MDFIKRNRFVILTLGVLLLVYFATRIFNIMSLPIFTDEAIYTRWSQIAKNDASWRFISLTDGKQPSFVWAAIVVMKFIKDPLLAARLVSVFAGAVTVIGLYFLGREVFNSKKIGVLSSALYVLYPFALVYDRMALYESLVSAFTVWTLYLEVLLVRRIRLDIALILGMVLGGFVLTKSSGFLFIYFLPIVFLLFDVKKKDVKQRARKLIILFLVSAGVAYGFYTMLRLSPFFHIIDEKNSIFVFSVGEWFWFKIPDKIHIFQSNMMGLLDWFIRYFTIPFTVLFIVSFFVSRKFLREKSFLALWFVLLLLVPGFFGKTLYPRYVLFMTMALLPLLAFSIYEVYSRIKSGWMKILFIVIITLLPLRTNYFILQDFARAPIPKLDLEQFINGWPSGGGVREAAEFFKEKSQIGPIFVGTQGTFGLMPYSLEIFLTDFSNVKISGYWPTKDRIPEDVLKMSEIMPAYFVFYQPCPPCGDPPGVAPKQWPLREVLSYSKGTGNARLTVYEVIPRK